MPKRKYSAIVALLIALFGCSCNYKYYTATDTGGVKHRLKEYRTIALQEKAADKAAYKYLYQRQLYNKDTELHVLSDKLIDCDSFKIAILHDSRKFSPLFIKGIIPRSVLNKTYIPYRLQMFDMSGKEIIDTTAEEHCVRDMHVLPFIKLGATRKIVKFKVTPFTFYIELTNEQANKKTSLDEFINGARLTWFCRGNRQEI